MTRVTLVVYLCCVIVCVALELFKLCVVLVVV